MRTEFVDACVHVRIYLALPSLPSPSLPLSLPLSLSLSSYLSLPLFSLSLYPSPSLMSFTQGVATPGHIPLPSL